MDLTDQQWTITVFMTQIMQMGLPAPYPLRRELRTLVYSAVIE